MPVKLRRVRTAYDCRAVLAWAQLGCFRVLAPDLWEVADLDAGYCIDAPEPVAGSHRAGIDGECSAIAGYVKRGVL